MRILGLFLALMVAGCTWDGTSRHCGKPEPMQRMFCLMEQHRPFMSGAEDSVFFYLTEDSERVMTSTLMGVFQSTIEGGRYVALGGIDSSAERIVGNAVRGSDESLSGLAIQLFLPESPAALKVCELVRSRGASVYCHLLDADEVRRIGQPAEDVDQS